MHEEEIFSLLESWGGSIWNLLFSTYYLICLKPMQKSSTINGHSDCNMSYFV